MTIWKFPISLYDDQGMIIDRPIISMPQGAQILTMQIQNDQPTLWAIVNPSAANELRRFAVVGTGQEMQTEPSKYIGTWQSNGFVFHVFELVDPGMRLMNA